jgi:hypothetical protein
MTLLTSHYVLADVKLATEPGCSGSPIPALIAFLKLPGAADA